LYRRPIVARTPQQKIGDRLEQKALTVCRDFFPDAKLAPGSGSLNGDGDILGIPHLFLECKNTATLGKGRSIGKQDWLKIKSQALRWHKVPVHLGLDDNDKVVALIPLQDLLGFMFQANGGHDATVDPEG
jgi:hypothetical protein